MSTDNSNAGKKPHGGSPSPGFAHEDPGHKHEEEHGEGNWLVSYADMMTLLVGFFAILLSFSSMDPEKFDEARKSITKEFGGNYQVPYAELAEHIKEVAKKLGVGDQLLIKQTEIGIEISSRGTVFFDTGSADLKEEARQILTDFIDSTRKELAEFDITIEGHTDDAPIVSGRIFRNNWELSSLRACRVLDTFVAAGFPKDRLTATGFGEARPLVPNRTTEGEPISENMAQNRRVVIKLTEHRQPSLERKDNPTLPPTQPKATDAAAAPAESPAVSGAPAGSAASAASVGTGPAAGVTNAAPATTTPPPVAPSTETQSH